MNVASVESRRSREQSITGESVAVIGFIDLGTVWVPLVEAGKFAVLKLDPRLLGIAEPKVQPITYEQFALLGESIFVLLWPAVENIVDFFAEGLFAIGRPAIVRA